MTLTLDLDYVQLNWKGTKPTLNALHAGLQKLQPSMLKWLALHVITNDDESLETPEQMACQLIQHAYAVMIHRRMTLVDFIWNDMQGQPLLQWFAELNKAFGMRLAEHEHIRDLANSEYYRIVRVIAANPDNLRKCKTLAGYECVEVFSNILQPPSLPATSLSAFRFAS